MLVRERLKTAPSPEAIDLLFGPRLENGLKDFDHMLRVHTAHAVMLATQRIITVDVGAALVVALRELQQGGLESMTLDAKLEDLFYNIEAHITARIGPRVAGQLHTGRSRNDLGATIDRMHVRDHVNEMCATAIVLREALLELAAEHVETVMPGYTHLKPAQPITFGYYLSGIASALERDTRRVERVYEFTNLNPLGAAALAGTSFPIDRDFTTRLLGFDGLLEHCLDAVASRDYALELLAALALLTTTVSRIASDFYVWQADEFGMMELADAIAGTSSIMPQKKNPHPLELAKGRAPQVYGALMASLAATKSAIFSNNGESGRAGLQQLEMALYESALAMRVITMVVRNVSVDQELMLARANRDFSSVTDLADMLVRQYGVSFREAHGIVGGAVQRAVKASMVATDITPEMLNEEAREIVGSDLDLKAEEIIASLDPVASVKGKLTVGGPAPGEVGRMVTEAKERLAVERARLEERRRKLAAADEELTRLVDQLAAG